MRFTPRLTRRRFLALASAGCLGVGLYTWRVEPHWLKVVRREMPVRNLPSALEGRTLIQLSDLHVGPVVDADYLIASLEHVNSLKPDLIVVTGDFMTCHLHEQVDKVAEVMEHLRPAELGTYASLGNHDYGLGWRRTEVADRLTRRLTDLGIHVLRNDVRSIQGLQLVGLEDYWCPAFDVATVFSRVRWDGPTLTLCHNPDALDDERLSACRGWFLAGHTHGGQCRPPFLPPPILPVKNRRYTAGEIAVPGGKSLYINRGLGYLRRVRFNVRPEITAFVLRRADDVQRGDS
ncbi:MAG: phosphoesterase [Planctomycetes bacterium]|nr:phosphoesterase [Planctomycetota bacterium]